MRTATWVLAAAVTLAGLVFGGWLAYWAIAGHGQTRRYEVNTHSQQYQAGLVSQERDRVTAYDVAVDPAQKRQIKVTFCQVYPDLAPPPDDLIIAHDRIC